MNANTEKQDQAIWQTPYDNNRFVEQARRIAKLGRAKRGAAIQELFKSLCKDSEEDLELIIELYAEHQFELGGYFQELSDLKEACRIESELKCIRNRIDLIDKCSSLIDEPLIDNALILFFSIYNNVDEKYGNIRLKAASEATNNYLMHVIPDIRCDDAGFYIPGVGRA